MPRDTAQRRAVQSVIREADRPLTPQEVLENAQQTVPNIGVATIYRTLKLFLEEQWLAVVEVPGEPCRYELAGKGHHHHFSCRACGRMYDFEGCPGQLDGLAPKGFIMEDHELFLFGRCADCAAA